MKRIGFPPKLAKRLARDKTRLPPVLVMTDETRLPDPVAAAERMPAGWGLIFRHYDTPERERLAASTAAICRRRGITLLIAGDWRLADRVNADGVHMPEYGLSQATVSGLRLWRRRGRLFTASAHDACSLRRAMRVDADAILLSPVEATVSHPERRALSALRFAALVRSATRPVIALGGLSLAQHKRVTALGAAAMAGISLLEDL